MTDQVDSLRVSYESDVAAKATADATALNQLGNAAETVETKVTRTTRSFAAVNKSLDETAALAAKAAAANKRYEDSVAAITAELDRGGISQAKADDLTTRASAKREQDMQAARRSAEALAVSLGGAATATETAAQATGVFSGAQARSVAAMEAAATQAQSLVNAFAGVSTGLTSKGYQDRAADIAAYGKAMDDARAKFNPFFAAARQYETTLAEIGTAEKQGAISAAEASSARTKAAADLSKINTALRGAKPDQDAFEKATRGGQMALRDLAMQSQDFIVQVTSGQGIFRPLVQQGSQVAQQLQAAGQSVFGSLRSAAGIALGAILTPMGLLITAATGAAVAVGLLVANSETASRRLNDLSVQLRATKDDYEALAAAGDAAARNAAKTSTVSLPDARTAYQTIAAVPNYHGSIDDITTLIRLSGDLARTFGETVPDSARRLATALQNPAAAAKDLAEKGLLGIDGASARVIERMQNQGDIVGAQGAIIDAYSKRLKGVQTETLTPIQKALEDLTHAFQGTGESGKGFGASLADVLRDQIALTIRDLAEFLRSLNAVIDAAMRIKNAFGKPLIDADTGKAPNASAELQRLDGGAVSKLIYDVAERNQIPANIADFGTRIAYQESRGRQFNADGSVLTSSAGAMGIGQLMPATAKELGVDATTAEGNVLGMLRYLVQLSKNPAFPTEVEQAGAYNAGPGGMAAYLAGDKTLKPETVDYVKAVAGVSIPNSRGGVQLPMIGISASRDPMGSLPDSVKAILLEPDTTFAKTEQDAWDRVTRLIRAQADLKAAGITSGDAYDSLSARIAKASGEYSQLGTAVELSNRGVTDQLAPLTAAAGAARTLAEAQNALTLAARASGEDVTAEQRAARNAAVQAQLSAAFRDSVVAVDQATAAQARINDAYDASSRSVVEATNRTKAEAEARKTAVEGTELYTAQVDKLTAAYNRQSAVQAEAQIRAKAFDQKDQLEQIRLETQLIGASADVRDRELALLRERQALTRAGGPEALNTTSGQADLGRVAAISNATAELQRQKNTLDELANIGTQAFDRIGTAITQAFATGSIKALDFGGLVKGVLSEIAQQVLKMAVLNPILNSLFGGQHRTTLGDAGGAIGSLLGNGGGSSSGVGGAVGAVSSIGSLGSTITGAQTSLTSGIGGILSSLSGNLTGGTVTSIGSLGSWIVGQVSSAIYGDTASIIGSTIATGTGIGVGNAATNAALAGAGSGVYGVATAGEVAIGAVSSATGISTAAISSAVSTVASALPAIGAAISVITNLAQGNYRGAGLVAGGALIGTAILPGIGTAVGAAIGGLVDAFLPNHPKHPFEDVELNVSGGRLATGKSDGQLADVDALVAGTKNYVDSINGYLDSVGVRIATADGNIGRIGQGITGLAQTLDPSTTFKKLDFTNATPDDRSNFSIAKGALDGMKFDTPQMLADALQRIAGFADAASTLGITLEHVGRDLSDIHIASVDGGRADATTSIQDAEGHDISYRSDLRTALNAALPGQSYADTTALDAAMQKVSDFVTRALPALLTPTRLTASSVQDQIQASNSRYAEAMARSRSYGLDNDAPLSAARDRAIEILMKPALDAINTTMTSVAGRRQTLVYGQEGANQATMVNLARTQDNERTSLYDQIHQAFGDNEVATGNYNAALRSLIDTQNQETAATQLQITLQKTKNYASLKEAEAGFADRAGTNSIEAKLAAFDAQATAETDTFIQQWRDYYGLYATVGEDFQNQMLNLSKAHAAERLKVEAGYVQASNGLMQSITDRNAAGQAITSLTTYARGLQTSAASALSTQDQYAIASRQFDAVSGAARAGDYGSTQQLQSYADAFLSTSRSLNGSGSAYASDFNRVIDALTAVSATDPDTLTASYMASIAQQQTDQLVVELQALRAEVAALRVETKQSVNTPSRMAG